LFVADKATGQPLELEALKIAADELKQARRPARDVLMPRMGRWTAGAAARGAAVAGAPLDAPGAHTRSRARAPPAAQTLSETFNTSRYEDVMQRINGRLGPSYTLDP
jgi:hypothetical protein